MASSTEIQYFGSIAELHGSKLRTLDRQVDGLWAATIEFVSHDGATKLTRHLSNVATDSFREVEILSREDLEKRLSVALAT